MTPRSFDLSICPMITGLASVPNVVSDGRQSFALARSGGFRKLAWSSAGTTLRFLTLTNIHSYGGLTKGWGKSGTNARLQSKSGEGGGSFCAARSKALSANKPNRYPPTCASHAISPVFAKFTEADDRQQINRKKCSRHKNNASSLNASLNDIAGIADGCSRSK